MSSKEMLELPNVGNHYVQLYQETAQLAEAVCHFITDKLTDQEGIIIVATPDHAEIFSTSLTFRGYDPKALISKGQLTFLDAKSLLDTFLVDGVPNAQLFLEALGPVFRKVFSHYSSVRVYGEMVNILWKNNEKDAAIQLEVLWNALLKDYNFSLLCAYEIDNLDHNSYNEAFNCVCTTHTHLLSPQDHHHFEKVILDVSKEIDDVDMTNMIYSVSKLGHPTTLMPPAQATLFHLSKHNPKDLEKILTRVKSNLSLTH